MSGRREQLGPVTGHRAGLSPYQLPTRRWLQTLTDLRIGPIPERRQRPVRLTTAVEAGSRGVCCALTHPGMTGVVVMPDMIGRMYMGRGGLEWLVGAMWLFDAIDTWCH